MSNKTNVKNINTWVITEGMAGTENQCLGICDHLGAIPKILKIKLNPPWNMLSPYIQLERKNSFSPSLESPWPDLLITSGRKSIAALRYIKKQSHGQTFCVHVQDPRINFPEADILAIAEHDPTRAHNVIVTKAALNRITPKKLASEAKQFPHLASLTGPRVAVLIGGSSKAYNMTEDMTRTLCEQLSHINGSLMITASRRTGEKNRQIIEKTLQSDQNFIWDGSGKNPYFAILGLADFILVTADSVSMLSEACTTGKPTYMIPLDGGHKRIDNLHENLIDYGCLRQFEGDLEAFSYEPLNDAKMIANEIRQRMNWK